MRWSGIIIGAWIGSRIAGPLGTLIGGVLGHLAQKLVGDYADEKSRETNRRANSRTKRQINERQLVFYASIAAMLAKLAKADGHVTAEEIRLVERTFADLGFTGEIRRYCVQVFRKAKDDSHTIYEYAAEFSSIVDSLDTRELLYETLWQLAAADGEISVEELRILKNLPRTLLIRPTWYNIYASQYGVGTDERDSSRRRQSAPPPREESPYEVLGIPSDSTFEEAKRAYRAAAKRYHPDMLRAQGVPEEMIGRATEKMARINAAWEQIKAMN